MDAVFLTGDVLATGAVLEANRRGWKVPDELAIAGSDDNELQEIVAPAIPRFASVTRSASVRALAAFGRHPGPFS